ncbi:FecCD family ABC transporter permease [Corynebacterium uberis]|uniref:FecCD family ABC transporter permease n=1 Tax=Corynebacterium TaxID=1716 RepID=UPI001D0B9D3B|nr:MULTISPECIES: iron chelate uptake ABC transporter family permease subunit [Corynebacterium]MCZ9309988.1 iron chelate uptake ABC transporter family permease subunit [Corynebacterium sp. c6VSa_13]UDL73740.1 iron chelate uptake ABC transporter family permease subunit [Corynebacterium uberis]UDL75377.1 iron chelate uptake ABC transporter family permease subunit [Corynebacterium uberis]UDL77588.1 iron chelate uptake ABC transporter family permease subunit [Corynebacterium uberis]UDL79875.1 iron 
MSINQATNLPGGVDKQEAPARKAHPDGREASVPTPPGTWRVALGRFSVLLDRRVLWVLGVLVAACLAAGVYTLGNGSSSVGYPQVLEVLRGQGTRSARLVVVEWRVPRIVIGAAVGVCLGVSGAVFQTITRNPLCSPDIIGFSTGAQTGILLAVMVFPGSLVSVSTAALIGGVATGAIIFALTTGGGFSGNRLVLAGIAIAAMLGSVNRYLMLRAHKLEAYGGLRAVTGSLEGAEWSMARYATLGTLVIVVALMACSRAMSTLALGPEIAIGLGTSVGRTQGLLVVLATAAVALATVAAGPIAFIALAAPHITRLITGAPTVPLVASGAMGAVMLLVADAISQTLFEGLPVGTVTAGLGGIYFMGLLVYQTRKAEI